MICCIIDWDCFVILSDRLCIFDCWCNVDVVLVFWWIFWWRWIGIWCVVDSLRYVCCCFCYRWYLVIVVKVYGLSWYRYRIVFSVLVGFCLVLVLFWGCCGKICVCVVCFEFIDCCICYFCGLCNLLDWIIWWC